MDRLQIKFTKRTGDRGPYHFTRCSVPAMIDLSDCIMHFYQNEEGGVLIVRHYDGPADERQKKERTDG
jgi:hypothetical protein